MKNIITIQRLEGLSIFLASTTVYLNNGFSILIFVATILLFDISMGGYLVNPKLGAITYNMIHSLIVPSLLTIIYIFIASDLLLGLICLWFAHIGMDRVFGYGLKLSTGFKRTHLGDIGKK